MIIKKFQAETETEAILKAKEELGKDAIVMNIKTVKPKGIYGIFKKSQVEITAAVDDNTSYSSDLQKLTEAARAATQIAPDPKPVPKPVPKEAEGEEPEKETAIEKRLNDLQKLLETQLTVQETIRETAAEISEPVAKKPEEEEDELGEKNRACIELIRNQLVNNEMEEKYVEQLITEIARGLSRDVRVDNILSNVYQKIILKLGQRKTIEVPEQGPRFLFFVGPTGVGKTTTIAKLASDLALKKKAKVALIASDTYRIAAVEQLRTYASILNIPIQVIYSPEDMQEARENLKDMDLVFVDTAGRSHRNEEQKEDIAKLLNSIPEEEREVFLVLSVTTKYRDLLKIVDSYTDITDYNLIFTKLDETSCIGNIYNIKMYTGKPLSYTTFGQNVPDDIGVLDAQGVAKKLLGGND